ncbi:hypothetical protein RUM44_006167 [Polyplax serrata]|uniref:Uncharacterized protein n=1 Tax=Polyplax serrata TaxID=468196 RepID=A0ABR1AZ47_POLSC
MEKAEEHRRWCFELELSGTNSLFNGEKYDDGMKMHEALMCKRIESDEDDMAERFEQTVIVNGNGNEHYNSIKSNGNSLTTEVPNACLQYKDSEDSSNKKAALKLNGHVKTGQPLMNGTLRHSETNGSLQQLLMLDNTKRNGEITPSLKKSKTPLIVVKTVNDLNNICNSRPKNGERKLLEKKDLSEEEEKIKEYLKRGDTAVIYQEPVDQKAKGQRGRKELILTYPEKYLIKKAFLFGSSPSE